MKVATASVTQRGQMTIPAEILREFGLAVPGKVQLVLADDGSLSITPVRPFSRWRGILPAFQNDSEDFDGGINAAKEEFYPERLAAEREE